jgi:hypothetical protein
LRNRSAFGFIYEIFAGRLIDPKCRVARPEGPF